MSTSKALIAELSDFYIQKNLHIDHFIKVYSFAKAIGEMEELDDETQQIVEIAALAHDVFDIFRLDAPSEEERNASHPESKASIYIQNVLQKLNLNNDMIDRIIHIILKRYDYGNISGIDHQILAEADTLINIRDANISKKEIRTFQNVLFKTNSGKLLFEKLYGIAH